jgi:RimJ/RimL family protein N-acetyltransferase
MAALLCGSDRSAFTPGFCPAIIKAPMNLSVRPLQEEDIAPLTNYWLSASPEFLTGMGVDLQKMPRPEEWSMMLNEQLQTPVRDKKSYCIIWLENDIPVGHSNISKITFGKEAYMHLHLWNNASRKKGNGTAFVKMTLPFYFNNYHLEKLYCEPYALNPAPNKTLAKAGFTFVKKYTCVPGILNFEQEVNLWEMSRETFYKLQE